MQRKLTAIVAADVVDYSLHLGRDEFATLNALERLRRDVLLPRVETYGGHIIRLMGDGSILAFDSALAALKFAMDAQRDVAERKGAETGPALELRMGVNLSDVIVQDGDVHGEGINVAVRLEELAPAGGICVSHSIYLQTKGAAGSELLPIGERQLRNIADPVFVWRWHPSRNTSDIGEVNLFPARKGEYLGRQILDPQVTALLVDLHMRSARLALSDAFDELLSGPSEGRNLSLEDIYRSLGDRLNIARSILHVIQIESIGDFRNSTVGLWQNPQSMAEFVSNVFDSASTSYAPRLLPLIKELLDTDQPALARRKQFMTLLDAFAKDEMAPRLKSVIKFAFVEPA
jgi:class 3 adenylate cyclase